MGEHRLPVTANQYATLGATTKLCFDGRVCVVYLKLRLLQVMPVTCSVSKTAALNMTFATERNNMNTSGEHSKARRWSQRLSLALAIVALGYAAWLGNLLATAPLPRPTPTVDEITALADDLLAAKAIASQLENDLAEHPELELFDQDWYFAFMLEQLHKDDTDQQVADTVTKLVAGYRQVFAKHILICGYYLAMAILFVVIAIINWNRPTLISSILLLGTTLATTPFMAGIVIGLNLGLNGLLWTLPATLLAGAVLAIAIYNMKLWRQRELSLWQQLLFGIALIVVGCIWVAHTYDLPSLPGFSRTGTPRHPSAGGMALALAGILLMIWPGLSWLKNRWNPQRQS